MSRTKYTKCYIFVSNGNWWFSLYFSRWLAIFPIFFCFLQSNSMQTNGMKSLLEMKCKSILFIHLLLCCKHWNDYDGKAKSKKKKKTRAKNLIWISGKEMIKCSSILLCSCFVYLHYTFWRYSLFENLIYAIVLCAFLC